MSLAFRNVTLENIWKDNQEAFKKLFTSKLCPKDNRKNYPTLVNLITSTGQASAAS